MTKHAQIQKVLSELGSNFDKFLCCFLVDHDEGREDLNTTISGPLSACQRNAI